MRFFKLLVASVLLVSMTACGTNKQSALEMQGYIKTIKIVGPDKITFEPISGTDQTKATSVDDGSALVFNWAAGDTLGIFPNKGNQVEFPITSQESSTSATFDGGGWALRNNASYAAYYPFNVWNYHLNNKTIMLDYSGQVQNGNGSFAHLSAYDYLASAKTTPENNMVTFQMDRQGSILYIDIVVPEPATINSLTISCDEAIFVEKAALDISGNNPVVTPIETKKSLTLNFENTATTEQNETVRAYMAVQPLDFSNKTVTATLRTSAGAYTAPVVSRVVNKGKAAFLRFSGNFTDGKTLDVMTFNVRYGTADDGANSWQYRRSAASSMINALRPAAFGVQEALDFQLDFLVRRCKRYKCVGVGREDGKSAGEHMSVFYDTTRVTLKDWGTYWLSETPDVPSIGWDAECRRTATWTLLEDKLSGKSFFFVNTHLDHVGKQARRNGLALIVNRIGKMNPDNWPMILCGDFNVYPDDTCLNGLRAMMEDCWQTASEVDDGTTWHDWGRITGGRHIDYIFYSRFDGCVSIRRVAEEYAGTQYVSDHYPVIARLRY